MCHLFIWSLLLRMFGELGFDVEPAIGRLIDRSWAVDDLWDEMVELKAGEEQ
jgi:hypothetical protein